MTKIDKIIYRFKMFYIGKILKKDTMNIKLEWFRKQGVKIGENTRCFSDPTAAEPYLLEIGNNVTISNGVYFTTHDYSIAKVIPNAVDLFGRIKIGDNCFIGQNSTILLGVELADNIIVAAGSVVTKSFLEEGVIIGGNPAKIIGNTKIFGEKYKDYIIDINGLYGEDRKNKILSEEHKFIKK